MTRYSYSQSLRERGLQKRAFLVQCNLMFSAQSVAANDSGRRNYIFLYSWKFKELSKGRDFNCSTWQLIMLHILLACFSLKKFIVDQFSVFPLFGQIYFHMSISWPLLTKRCFRMMCFRDIFSQLQKFPGYIMGAFQIFNSDFCTAYVEIGRSS